MRGLAKTALLAAAIVVGALTSAFGQSNIPPRQPLPPVIAATRGTAITPLGWYVMGSVAVAAVSPMIASAILGRELTLGEAYHVILGSMLGPVGWLLADALVPPTATGNQPPPRKPGGNSRGNHFKFRRLARRAL